MTSEKVMLTVAVASLLLLGGCEGWESLRPPKPQVGRLESPYLGRRVWAVAPLRNDSGSRFVDVLQLSDQLHGHLDRAAGIDVLAVNRTLAAMQAEGMDALRTAADIRRLITRLGVDGLVVGSVTAYHPYDPPRLGLALELWVDQRADQADRAAADLRGLSSAATGEQLPASRQPLQHPASIASDVVDASDGSVIAGMQRYAIGRGKQPDEYTWRRYRISMDLYGEFVTYVMSSRLLEAERQRLAPRFSSVNTP